MGLIDRAKAAYFKREAKKLPSQKEIEIMAEEAKKSGVPPWVANVLSLVGGVIVAAVQDVAAGGNLVSLVGNPKALVAAVVSAVLIRFAHSLNPPKKD